MRRVIMTAKIYVFHSFCFVFFFSSSCCSSFDIDRVFHLLKMLLFCFMSLFVKFFISGFFFSSFIRCGSPFLLSRWAQMICTNAINQSGVYSSGFAATFIYNSHFDLLRTANNFFFFLFSEIRRNKTNRKKHELQRVNIQNGCTRPPLDERRSLSKGEMIA